MTDFATRRTVMVDTQVRPSDVTTYSIIDAMLKVARERYVPDSMREAAYAGENIEIGGQRVVLEARTFAKMLDALDIRSTELVLDIGCALGYSAAVMARLADAVIAVEESALAEEAERNLSEDAVDNAVIVAGDITQGAAKHGPYDVILIEGGVEEIPPAILDQLKESGRIAAVFMERNLGVVRIGYKVDGIVNWRPLFNASAPILPGFEKVRDFVL
ncbi:protein-L-isoaspartate O-methyltransferase [Falsirhodobacter sp. alg1]|uniref:protein-L-isoaspartate O-methyltransferase family protein n=1 Tax=Falsirhodobacter sp. alg1 TaxID=1472418 RepID=UPI0005EE741B|nr:protein-L-isoaspartate O-methyltransferase [Falsirhodobacter sp. alg1]